MSSNTNIGNTPVNQGYVQLIHTGETGGIDGTLRTLYDGDGTAADLLIASDKVKVSTELFIGAKTLTEFIQDTVGTMFTTGNSLTNVSVTYDDANNNIDLNATGEVTLTGSQTLTNKTLTSPVINTSVSGTAILDEDNMSSNSDSKLATQQSIKAYVDAEVSSLVSSAPTALDTLDELAAALGDDANFATTTATSLGEKLVKASNLSDLTNTTTARSNLGLGSLATANNISVSNFNDAALQTSSESFADNDTSLMTSAAIQDKIESFGFTTNTGDMTGVSITASNPLDISQSNTTSGSYSATISLVASEFGGYLADMTDLVVGGTDELAVLDNGTLKRKQIDEIRLTAFDATGFSSGISFDGSTANGVLTFKDSDEATVESNLTFDGTDLAIASSGKLLFGGGNHTYINEDIDDRLRIFVGGQEMIRLTEGSTDHVMIPDNVRLSVGNGNDFQAFHNETDTFLKNNTGDFYISNDANDKDLILRSDDGSGGQTAYLTLDGSAESIEISKKMQFPASHSADKIVMYSGGNEKIGTEANTLLFTADNYKLKDTNGDVNLFMNNSGNVGIGTSSPSTKLEVASGNSGGDAALDSPTIRLNNTTQSTDWDTGDVVGTLEFYIEDASGNAPYVTSFIKSVNETGNGTLSSGALTFGVADYNASGGAAEAMRISEDGNVGIGTTSPTAKLDVRGNVNFFSSDASDFVSFTQSDNGIIINSAGSTSNKMTLNTGGTTALTIDASQNIGIGQTSPSARLDVVGSGNAGIEVTGGSGYVAGYFGTDFDYVAKFESFDASAAIVLEDSNSTGNYNRIGVATHDMFFITNNSERMRIDSSGNIGIGETSIDANLHITGSPVVLKMERAGHRAMRMGTPSNSSLFVFADSDNLQSNQRMVIDNSGNIGIGTTSPDTLLHVDEDDSATAFKVTGGSGGNKIASFIRDEGVSSPHAEVYIHAGSGDPQITFRDVGNEYFSIGLDDSANSFKISDHTGVGTNDRLTIDSSGDIKIEESLGIGVSASGTTGRLDCSNDVVAFASSDKRLKENIKPLDNALDKINKINGVEFDWKKLTEKEKETIHGNTGHDVGVIAQEIEEVLPEVVQTRDNGYKAVKYEKIVPLLIEAIKELKQEIEDLK